MKKKRKKSMKQLIKEANENLLNPDKPGWGRCANRILKAIGLKVRVPNS